MTHAGRSAFRSMAQAHSEWITEFLSDLSADDMALLNAGLMRLKQAVQTRLSKSDPDLGELESLQATNHTFSK
jgi:hypothetical protein